MDNTLLGQQKIDDPISTAIKNYNLGSIQTGGENQKPQTTPDQELADAVNNHGHQTGTLGAYGQTIVQAAKGVPAYIGQAVEGGTPFNQENGVDQLIKDNQKSNEQFANGPDAEQPVLGGLAKVKDIKGSAGSLTSSLATMAPTVVGGLIGGALGGPAAPVTAAVGATIGGFIGGGIGYLGMSRQSENQLIRDVVDKEDQTRAAQNKPLLNQDEKIEKQNAMLESGDPQLQGAAEAGGETIGNFLEIAAAVTPLGKLGTVIKSVAGPFTGALATAAIRGAGILATENIEEQATNLVQNPIAKRQGLPEATAAETAKQTTVATLPFAAFGVGVGFHQDLKTAKQEKQFQEHLTGASTEDLQNNIRTLQTTSPEDDERTTQYKQGLLQAYTDELNSRGTTNENNNQTTDTNQHEGVREPDNQPITDVGRPTNQEPGANGQDVNIAEPNGVAGRNVESVLQETTGQTGQTGQSGNDERGNNLADLSDSELKKSVELLGNHETDGSPEAIKRKEDTVDFYNKELERRKQLNQPIEDTQNESQKITNEENANANANEETKQGQEGLQVSKPNITEEGTNLVQTSTPTPKNEGQTTKEEAGTATTESITEGGLANVDQATPVTAIGAEQAKQGKSLGQPGLTEPAKSSQEEEGAKAALTTSNVGATRLQEAKAPEVSKGVPQPAIVGAQATPDYSYLSDKGFTPEEIQHVEEASKTHKDINGWARGRFGYDRVKGVDFKPSKAINAPVINTEVDVAAHEAAASPLNDLAHPSKAQIEAGNPKLGHIQNFHGMSISIENPMGSTRAGVSPEGVPWQSTLKNHYGYIKGTIGNDNDHVDTFIGPDHGSTKAFIVNQNHVVNGKVTGKFDEHKVILGAKSKVQALKIYHDNYEKGFPGAASITQMSVGQLKEQLGTGKLTKPILQTQVNQQEEVSKTSKTEATPPKGYMSTGDVFAKLTPSQRALHKSGKLVVVPTEEQLPASLRPSKGEEGSIPGLYHPKEDKVYVVAHNIKHEELNGILAHEFLHRAVRVDKVFKGKFNKFDQGLSRRFNMAGRGIGSDIEKAAYKHVVDAGTPQHQLLDEYKSYLVQEYAKNPESFVGEVKRLIEEFIAAIKVALVNSGLDAGFIEKLTPADLYEMSKYGAEKVEATQGQKSDEVLKSFIGVKSQTAPKYELSTAMSDIEAGEDPEAVRQDTGWFKGVDGHWRFEIDDSEAKIDEKAVSTLKGLYKLGRLTGLDKILVHPKLFVAYPQLKNITIKFAKLQDGVGGGTSSDGKNITLNVDLKDDKILSVLLHEAQHVVQVHEGWAGGGSPSTFQKEFVERVELLEKIVKDINSEMSTQYKIMNDTEAATYGKYTSPEGYAAAKRYEELLTERAEAVTALHRIGDSINVAANSRKIYSRLYGEIEARNVQRRLEFSSKERENLSPESTQDYRDKDAVILWANANVKGLLFPDNEADLLYSKKTEGKLNEQSREISTKESSEYTKRNNLNTSRLDRASHAEKKYFQERIGNSAERVRGIKGVFSPGKSIASDFEKAGVPSPEYHEWFNGPKMSEKYMGIMNKARDTKFGAAVYVYPKEDYQKMRLFATPDELSVFAIKSDGDIVSVASLPGAPSGRVHSMLSLATELGGTKLDAFDTVLPEIYAMSGFKEVGRVNWNEDYKPDNWNKEVFSKFNNGEPDVVFMEYDPTYDPFKRSEIEISLSNSQHTIPGIDKLNKEFLAGDNTAGTLLRELGHDSLDYLTSGIKSVSISYRDPTGVYGGEKEPSLGIVASFEEKDRKEVLRALAQFAKNFNQEQFHILGVADTNTELMHVYDDGSYNTKIYNFTLNKEPSEKEVSKLINDSGLYGLTIDGKTLETYYVEQDQNDANEYKEWADKVNKLHEAISGRNLKSYGEKVARLWVYGKGNRAISYDKVEGKFHPSYTDQGQKASQRVASRLIDRDIKAPAIPKTITPEQSELQRSIAQAYDEMRANALDQANVRRAYKELASEVLDQYNAMPIKVEVWSGQGEPYSAKGKVSSAEMRKDVAENNHLYIYKTEVDSFGPTGVVYDNHPLLEQTGITDINGVPLVYNDLLRAVHDYYAHTMTPSSFGPIGEESSWKTHMLMTRSPWAKWALTSETRGQNSWVNFRSSVQGLPLNERGFAVQKVDLLPKKFLYTGDIVADANLSELPDEDTLYSKNLDMSKEARMQRAKEQGFDTSKIMYHGTGGNIKAFDLSFGGQTSRSEVGKLGVSLSDAPLIANEFAGMAGRRELKNANVMQLLYKPGKQLEINLPDAGLVDTIKKAWADGYDSVRFNNYRTPLGYKGNVYIIRNPSDIRSIYAAFEPSQQGSSDILYSKAKKEGYTGSVKGESLEWISAKNKGLDMSHEARMQRAKDMGFDVDNKYFVSSLEDIREFLPHGEFAGYSGVSGISVTDNPKLANRYLERYWDTRYDGTPFSKNVIPVFIKPGNMLDVATSPYKSPVQMGYPLPSNYVNPLIRDGYDSMRVPDSLSLKGGVKHSDAKNALRGHEIVLTRPDQIRSVHAAFDPDFVDSSNILYSKKTKPKLYSALERGISNSPERIFNAPASQVKSWLYSNAPKLGIKADEIYWTGVNEYLDSLGNTKTSKQSVLEFISKNRVTPVDRLLGEETKGMKTLRNDISSLENEIDELEHNYPGSRGNEVFEEDEDGNEVYADPDYVQELREEHDQIIDEKIKELDDLQYELKEYEEQVSTRHAGTQLNIPGGEDYRELVITIPGIDKFNEEDTIHFGDVGEGGEQIAWLRYDSRTDSNGESSLLLQEVQSQRGAEGRTKGFGSYDVVKSYEISKKLHAITLKEINLESELENNGGVLSSDDWQKLNDLKEERALLIAEQKKEDAKRALVPPAPFITDSKNKSSNAYISLLMKKAVIQAIGSGHSSVSWTTGDQQADRYDLSKTVSAIRYNHLGDLAITKVDDKVWQTVATRVPENKVADYIGKEAAERLLGQTKDIYEHRTISGDNLKVGGVWTQEMYGNEQGLNAQGKPALITQAASDIARKFGGRISSIKTIETGEVPALIITPEMREKVLEEDLPLFSRRATIAQAVQKQVQKVKNFATGFDQGINTLADMRSVLNTGHMPVKHIDKQSILDKVATYLVDSSRPFDVWTRRLPNSVKAAQLILSKDLAKRRTAVMSKEALDTYLKPLSKVVKKIADDIGMEHWAAQSMAGYWMSMRYAIEKNGDFVRQDKEAYDRAVDDLMANPTNANMVKLVNKAADKQADRIAAINEQREIDPNEETLGAGLAGGYNDFTANKLMREIESKIPRAYLEEAAQHVYDMMKWKTERDLRNGKVTQDQVSSWFNSPFYVPLTGDPSIDESEDSLFNSGGINQAKDKSAVGRKGSLAQNGIDAATEQVEKSAKYHGWVDFKNRLVETYDELLAEEMSNGASKQEAKDNIEREYGITKTPETRVVGTDQGSLLLPSQNPTGITVRRNGEAHIYDLHNQEAVDALKSVNKEDVPSILRPVANFTRTYARFVTQLLPGFGPVNAIRDTWERSENIRTRVLAEYPDLDMDKVAKDAIRTAADPRLIRKIAGVMLENSSLSSKFPINENDQDIKALRALIEEGGASTVGDYLATSGKDLAKQMKDSLKLSTEAWNLVSAWNNSFELVSSLSIFKGLTNQGVNAKTAAAATLNLMNFGKQGTAIGPLKALYTFVNPTVQGGHQLIQTLSTRKGQARAVAYTLAGIALYGMLRAWDGDDDDLGENKMDNQGMFISERNILIPYGDGNYVKVPVGFGLPQLTWSAAVNLDKWMFGKQKGEDTVAGILKSTARNFAPVAPSETNISQHPIYWMAQTFSPQIAKPLVNVGLNINTFGSSLTNQGYGKDNVAAALQGRKSTAQEWKDIAVELGKLGIDLYPEQVREIVRGFAVGPVNEVIKAAIENPNKESLGRTTVNNLVDRWVSVHDSGALKERLYYIRRDEMNAAAKKESLGVELSTKEAGLAKLNKSIVKLEGSANGNRAAAAKAIKAGKSGAEYLAKATKIRDNAERITRNYYNTHETN